MLEAPRPYEFDDFDPIVIGCDWIQPVWLEDTTTGQKIPLSGLTLTTKIKNEAGDTVRTVTTVPSANVWTITISHTATALLAPVSAARYFCSYSDGTTTLPLLFGTVPIKELP